MQNERRTRCVAKHTHTKVQCINQLRNQKKKEEDIILPSAIVLTYTFVLVVRLVITNVRQNKNTLIRRWRRAIRVRGRDAFSSG